MTDVSDLAEMLKTQAAAMASITMRATPDEEQSKIYRDMSTWMHGAAVLMNAASAALTAAAQVREGAPMDVNSREAALWSQNMRFKSALEEIAAKFDTGPTTISEAAGLIAAEFQRRMNIAGEAIGLLPIYSATEPDEGPNVLGLRKGEEP